MPTLPSNYPTRTAERSHWTPWRRGPEAFFIKGFLWNLFNFLRNFCEDNKILMPFPQVLQNNLYQVWCHCIIQAAHNPPTPPPPVEASTLSNATGQRPRACCEIYVWWPTASRYISPSSSSFSVQTNSPEPHLFLFWVLPLLWQRRFKVAPKPGNSFLNQSIGLKEVDSSVA